MEIDEEKLKQLVEQLKQEKPEIKRIDIYKTENLALAITAYTDKKGNLNILLSVHGKKPSNSLSFPPSYIDELLEIANLLKKNKEKFNIIGETERPKAEVDIFKKK